MTETEIKKLHVLLTEVAHHIGEVAVCVDTLEYDPITEEDKKDMCRCLLYNIRELRKTVEHMEKIVVGSEVAE